MQNKKIFNTYTSPYQWRHHWQCCQIRAPDFSWHIVSKHQTHQFAHCIEIDARIPLVAILLNIGIMLLHDIICTRTE